MEYKVSVIMPIYNAENELKRTIQSIINQSIGFEKIELILVDDKSTDNTKSVIEDYASKYSNIKPIFLSKNSGFPGFVRNKGIKIATSKYIMFIDSDDEYEIDMCEKLYNTIIENDCDLVSCNYKKINYLTGEISKNKYSNENRCSDIEDILCNTNLLIWNKIFKKSIIQEKNITFVTDRIGEDTFFCVEYCINSNLVINLNNYYGYKYVDRGGSFSTTNLTWNLKVINHYYDTLNILNRNQVKINLNKFFIDSIEYSISSTIQMVENDMHSIKQVLKKLYLFEKKINFSNNEKIALMLRLINYFIIKNHLNIATLLVLILNRRYKIKSKLKTHRKKQ